jgi:hypothetical protein
MRWEILAAAAALCATAQAAWADTHVLSSAGEWEAFGGTTTSGRPVCGMSSSTNGRYLGVKYFSGDTTWTVQLGTTAWTVENGAKQRLEMQFDENAPWNATGTGMHFNDGDAGIEYTISRDELDQFVSEFRGSAFLYIRFLGSNVASWTSALAGTQTLGEVFNRCVRELK